jgi:hypothetical protein
MTRAPGTAARKRSCSSRENSASWSLQSNSVGARSLPRSAVASCFTRASIITDHSGAGILRLSADDAVEELRREGAVRRAGLELAGERLGDRIGQLAQRGP